MPSLDKVHTPSGVPYSEIKLTAEEKKLIEHYYYLYTEEFRSYRDNKIDELRKEGYGYYIANVLAKREALSYLHKFDKQVQEQKGTWKCPICQLQIKDMYAHVTSLHKLSWDSFVKTYSWHGGKVFFDPAHRDRLSKNKLEYYNETSEGLSRKHAQHNWMSGSNNPACKLDVRKKISKSRLGKSFLTDTGKENISRSTKSRLYSPNAISFGYRFRTIHNGEEITLRSKTEYTIFLMLKQYSISFEYEPFKIEYADPSVNYMRHYMVDFVANGMLFEVKSDKYEFLSDPKYALINKALQKANRKLHLLTPNNFYPTFKIPEADQLPLTEFENMIVNTIVSGDCKIEVPKKIMSAEKVTSSFLLKLGDDPYKTIAQGDVLYENKKCAILSI